MFYFKDVSPRIIKFMFKGVFGCRYIEELGIELDLIPMQSWY